jgi:hypothetical protein
MVSNLVARVTSEKVALVVNVYPVVIVTAPAGTNVITGGTIRLAANATGTRPFFFEWFKDGVLIPNAFNEQLLISSASTNDSGEYRVRISNSENWVTSDIAKVTVREAPVVEGSLFLSRSPTGLLHLSGVATANATYELQWSDNLGNPIWTRLQDVAANSTGLFEVIITPGQSRVRFIRAVRN